MFRLEWHLISAKSWVHFNEGLWLYTSRCCWIKQQFASPRAYCFLQTPRILRLKAAPTTKRAWPLPLKSTIFMCAARRRTSTRLTRLAAKASPYHAAVTLYEAQIGDGLTSPEAGPSNPLTRRSSRVKEEPVDGGRPGVDTDAPNIAKKTNPTPRQKRVKTETETDTLNASPKKPKIKPTSKSKPKAVLSSLDVPHPAPARWSDAYNAIKEMRSRIVAPVDTMGCDRAQDGERDPKVSSLRVLFVVHLDRGADTDPFCLYTTESTVRDARVVDALFTDQGRGDRRGSRQTARCTRRRVVCASRVEGGRSRHLGSYRQGGVLATKDAVRFLLCPFVSCSRPIILSDLGSRYASKLRYIKHTAQRLDDDFDADVPKTVEELCSLPGVGPKMAYLTLQVAWNLYVAFSNTYSYLVRMRISLRGHWY